MIEPLFIKTGGTDGIKENMPFVERQAIVCIVKHWNEDKYLCLKWKKNDWQGFVVGGIEDGEKSEISGAREITEETGYKNPKFVKKLGGTIHSQFYHEIKKQNRFAHFEALYFELQNGEHSEIAEEEKNLHEVVWISKEKVAEFALRDKDMEFIWKRYLGELCYTGDGIMVNSGKFDGLSSEDARKKITEAVNGKFITRYKMRDAVFARQRYWGEPIPLYRDKEGILHEVKKLPLTLPNVKSYEPTGRAESPLAGVPAWTKKGYETNTMPGWAGSSWYFLRYMDPKNKKALASDEELSYWKKVDVYVGGAEHATGHLLYSRFWNKFLKDIGISKVEEPFLELHNQGLIMATDGRKMSKRWGNVINPDDIVKLYGADTLRIYEMFMGPFDQAVAWSTESIIGSRRFLERVWRLSQKVKAEKPKVQTDKTAEKVIHKTIKKVGEDIEIMNFNTAISALMICINEMEKAEYISVGDFKMFLQILAPFAPHMTEEIWREMDEKKSIHISSWPKFDSKKTVDEDFTLVIQVNGKVRAEINAPMSISEAEAEKIARNHPAIQTWIEGKTIRKVIYVKNKLVNIVAI